MNVKNYLFLIILLLVCVNGKAQNTALPDSILHEAQQYEGSERLEQINSLLIKYGNMPIRLPLAHLLVNEARSQRNDEYYANAAFALARHFYSFDPDSMRYWIDIAEPLFIRLGKIEEVCRMKGWNAFMYVREGRDDRAMETIEDMKQFSDSNSFHEGYEMADQALANLYATRGMYDDFEKLNLDGLKRMEERGAPAIKKINILRQLFSRIPTVEAKLKYLKMAEDILNEAKAQGLTQLDDENQMYSLDYMIYLNYANNYVNIVDLEKARYYIDAAQSVVDEHQLARARIEMAALRLNYYLKTEDYRQALHYADIVIDNYQQRGLHANLLSTLKTKALALEKIGQAGGANEVYRKYIQLKDSISVADLNHQLADLRTRYEVEKLELQNEQIEADAKRMRSQVMFLIIGCLVLFVAILGLIYMVRIINKSRGAYKRAKEKAEEADRMKSAFLANMNHEIRTPLNAIVGFSQVLIDEEDKDIRREFAGIIQNNNELLQRLIADVLDISKIESNSMSLIYSQQSLPDLMKEIYSMILLRMQNGVELILDPCEPQIIDTDRNRLVQIMTNLLTNAIKHTPKGYIRFGYETIGSDMRLYVKDTGEGIDESQLESIFNRFVQLKNGKRGVGLGLAISKGLVTAMGGTIWATSVVGKGSIFYVQIPIKKPNKDN